ncbi:MAG: biotin--[acetyl-CoA-carboxylase] ligase [Brumimicrobium sp.]
MQKAFIGHKIIHLESVDSTNNYTAKVFKSGTVDSGTVIMADIQTNGRGQRGNMWQSGAFKNITMSIAASPKLWQLNNLVTLNHITALALYEFISKHVRNTKIKWPNDIIVNDLKIGGILIESQYSGESLQSIIGIGINVNQSIFNQLKATSLFNETGKHFEPKHLVFEFINAFNKTVDRFQQKGASYILNQYNDLLWLKEKQSRFESEGYVFKGVIKETDLNGNLRMLVEDQIKSFRNGEISYLHSEDNLL